MILYNAPLARRNMKLLVMLTISILSVSVFACPLQSKTVKCANTRIDNRTSTWTTEDAALLKQSKERCRINYPGTPCLTHFIKYEDGSYQLTCSLPIGG